MKIPRINRRTCFLSSSCRGVSVLIILHFPSRFFPPFHLCSLLQNLNLKNGIIWAPLFSTFNCILLMERTGKKKEEGLGEGYQYFFLYFPLLAMVFAITVLLFLWSHILCESSSSLAIVFFFFFLSTSNIIPSPAPLDLSWQQLSTTASPWGFHHFLLVNLTFFSHK